ncbi:hypothetical protein PR003_g18447 [Phytophthora rubi]|uniref:Uncharacterized protein n=1 Tax=Phytophthora rubi TaxID=129364 RepID=A0A6A4E658_9STRA|nr:hypothetical protein PR003_g18447 [Phytophthora rubi]
MPKMKTWACVAMSTGWVVMHDTRGRARLVYSSMDMRPFFTDEKVVCWRLSSWGSSNTTPQVSLHARHRREAGGFGDKLAECPLFHTSPSTLTGESASV